MRGRRPVAGWPHGRLIGLLDRDVPTTTTLLLLLCTGAHYSRARVLRAVARSRASVRSKVYYTCPDQAYATLRIRLGNRREWGARGGEQCGYVERTARQRLAREVSSRRWVRGSSVFRESGDVENRGRKSSTFGDVRVQGRRRYESKEREDSVGEIPRARAWNARRDTDHVARPRSGGRRRRSGGEGNLEQSIAHAWTVARVTRGSKRTAISAPFQPLSRNEPTAKVIRITSDQRSKSHSRITGEHPSNSAIKTYLNFIDFHATLRPAYLTFAGH